MLLGKSRKPSVQSEPPPQWEYRNVSVPLQIQGRGSVMQMGHRLDPILAQAVITACHEGWEPAEPVTLVWLAQQGRVRSRLDQTCVLYESATVRLRRRRAHTAAIG